ncbi:MAG: hypothetical protein Kow00129_12260 [Thermoleophilia bacterium]
MALLWWFSRDVTYVANVKVSGLDSIESEYQEPLREVAEEFAWLVNRLAEMDYAWQAGGLPALRTGEALTDEEAEHLLAVLTVEVESKSRPLEEWAAPRLLPLLEERGWHSEGAGAALGGAQYETTAAKAKIRIRELRPGRERLTFEVTAER